MAEHSRDARFIEKICTILQFQPDSSSQSVTKKDQVKL